MNIDKLFEFTGFIAICAVKILLNKKQKPRKRKIAVVGLTCLDVHAWPVNGIPDCGSVAFVDDVHLSLAGTAAAVAVTASRLGLDVSLYGCIASDFIGEILMSLMQRSGLRTDHLNVLSGSKWKTSATVINARENGDRPALHQLGAADQLTISEKKIRQICEENKFLHIGGLGLTAGTPYGLCVLPLLRAAKAHHLEDEITTTLDLIAPHEETLSMLKTVLPFVDFFMPSIEEAESISLLRGPLDCGTYFLSIGVRRACIFKAGVLGSYLTCRRDSPVDQQMAAAVAAAPTSSSFAATKQIMHIHTSAVTACYRIAAFNINDVPSEILSSTQGRPRSLEGGRVVDTTGCGDNYCAGFLVGLSRGLSVPAACLVGTATSGLCALGVGSDAGNVDWYLVEKFALAVPSHLEIKSDVESIITGTGSSGEPTAEAGFLSPPPAALAQRLQKLINKVADSDDENTPVRGTIGPTVSVRK